MQSTGDQTSGVTENVFTADEAPRDASAQSSPSTGSTQTCYKKEEPPHAQSLVTSSSFAICILVHFHPSPSIDNSIEELPGNSSGIEPVLPNGHRFL